MSPRTARGRAARGRRTRAARWRPSRCPGGARAAAAAGSWDWRSARSCPRAAANSTRAAPLRAYVEGMTRTSGRRLWALLDSGLAATTFGRTSRRGGGVSLLHLEARPPSAVSSARRQPWPESSAACPAAACLRCSSSALKQPREPTERLKAWSSVRARARARARARGFLGFAGSLGFGLGFGSGSGLRIGRRERCGTPSRGGTPGSAAAARERASRGHSPTPRSPRPRTARPRPAGRREGRSPSR